jgi:demethylspheroidene O-methyltransferase
MSAAAAMTWPERWFALRDRLYASPAFHRWAAAFPFTRHIAQRRARALFDVVAGFVYSQVLYACVRLRLFEILAEGPQTLQQLAPRLNLPRDGAERLLAAAVSLQLVQRRRGERYGLGPLGAPMVGNRAVCAMVEHHAVLYADLQDPLKLLRGESAGGALAGVFPYATADAPGALGAERVASYSALMSASQPLVADQILDAYPVQRHRCLLDVGGGEGTFLTTVAARAPELQLMLFDLPAVAERARTAFAARGLAQRAQAFGGDFLHDELPRGADIATLVRVVHDHDDERVLRILKAVRRALPDDGTLLLAEAMADTAGAEPMGDAYFGFYLLAMGRGQPRTPARLTALLQGAGFGDIRLLRTHLPLQARLLVARCRRAAAHAG